MSSQGPNEEYFHHIMSNLPAFAPDGILEVDLNFLHEIGLLQCRDEHSDLSQSLTDSFHVVESWEKITLNNANFLIWIVPRVVDSNPITYTLITQGEEDETRKLEVVFSTDGIYNSPKLILKVLEYFLKEIEENENVIAEMR